MRNMQKTIHKNGWMTFLILLLLVGLGLQVGVITVHAEDSTEASGAHAYLNTDTRYSCQIEDDADLLTDSEEQALLATMEGVTRHGNALFKTVAYNSMSASAYAEMYVKDVFGADKNSVIFLIDMQNRKLYIYSTGALYDELTKAYANTITDNIYKYASAAQYYACANEAFVEISSLLDGYKISQPMKYISNTLLGIVLALILNYFIVRLFSAAKQPSANDVMRGIFVKQELTNFDNVYERETRTYSPQSSGSGGSGGGSSGGGGGGGGGGGHSF